jgi:hypothetical protein
MKTKQRKLLTLEGQPSADRWVSVVDDDGYWQVLNDGQSVPFDVGRYLQVLNDNDLALAEQPGSYNQPIRRAAGVDSYGYLQPVVNVDVEVHALPSGCLDSKDSTAAYSDTINQSHSLCTAHHQGDTPPNPLYTAQDDTPPNPLYTAQDDTPPNPLYTVPDDAPPNPLYTAQDDTPPNPLYTAQDDTPPNPLYTAQDDTPPNPLYTAQTIHHLIRCILYQTMHHLIRCILHQTMHYAIRPVLHKITGIDHDCQPHVSIINQRLTQLFLT